MSFSTKQEKEMLRIDLREFLLTEIAPLYELYQEDIEDIAEFAAVILEKNMEGKCVQQ